MNIIEAKIILAIQQASCPFLDYLFYVITLIGSEYFFLALAAIIFWCINKRYGYKFFSIFIMGQFVVGVIKFAVGRQRPYTLKTDKGDVRAIIETTEGGSFPSGHSQNAANISTQLSIIAKDKNHKLFIRTLLAGLVVTLLVMFSRLYLGQHFLSDVICGALLGVICTILFSRLFNLLKDKEERLFLVVLPLTVIATAICIGLNKNPEQIIKVLGIFGAMSLGYFLEKRYVGYKVRSGSLVKQIVKVLIGVLVLLLIKEGLNLLAKAYVGGHFLILFDYIRYFLIGIAASLCLPAFFKAVKL